MPSYSLTHARAQVLLALERAQRATKGADAHAQEHTVTILSLRRDPTLRTRGSSAAVGGAVGGDLVGSVAVVDMSSGGDGEVKRAAADVEAMLFGIGAAARASAAAAAAAGRVGGSDMVGQAWSPVGFLVCISLLIIYIII